MCGRTSVPCRRVVFPSVILAVLSLTTLRSSSSQTRQLTFEERVKAQEAIERVYYSHQIGATRPVEEAVTHELLKRKVRTYLKQSVALEKLWNTPVTAAALQAEMDRIASSTRLPERLQEVYRALGDDPALIAESLARPVLVDRLARSFFAFDQRIHAAPRKEAEDLRWRLAGGALDVSAEHPNRQILELIRRDHPRRLSGEGPSAATGHPGAGPSGTRIELSPDEFARWRARPPKRVGEIGPVREERDAFVVSVALEETTDGVRLAVYTIPKIPWEKWWEEAAEDFDEAAITATAARSVRVLSPVPRREAGFDARARTNVSDAGMSAASPTCIPDDTWDNGILDDLLTPRFAHTAVWTGRHMIVWGGLAGNFVQDTGTRYDPLTDTWAPTTTIRAPVARYLHTAIWSGTVMVIWGGSGLSNSPLATGGRYDPVADSWEPTSTLAAPTRRVWHTAVWTGNEMIIWGGTEDGPYVTSGARYDPVTDVWVQTSMASAPTPRIRHTAVWTGGEMIIWGGVDVARNSLNNGGRYDPTSDRWRATSITSVPEGRQLHTAVWTGSRMIVWGGSRFIASNLNTGGQYDPISDTWAPTSTTGAPSYRNSHTAIWTGSEMIVWGGQESFFDFEQALVTGGRYDPASDSWLPTSMMNAPSARAGHTAVWTGSQMIVWGGRSHTDQGSPRAIFNSGGRYDPASDNWTPTSVLGTPGGVLCCHTAVWTGNFMIVWGGLGEIWTSVNSGARYDLMTDTWTPTSLRNAPGGRYSHQAVWSGTEMIVWGGPGHNDGGRYDPVSDEWRPLSTTGAPSPRHLTTPAVWTGSEMIVWGGSITTTTTTNTGGRYNPAIDSWRATSTTDAPSPRWSHTAVWTGSEMIVWGGAAPFLGFFNTGGRYDPVSDSWKPVSLTGAPTPRATHNAVWTGRLMIVWGGDTTGGLRGGRYEPATDTWTPTSTANAPVFTNNHTAVWTGKRMIIWSDNGTGGLYDPAADAWAPTSKTNAPSYAFATPNADATAVWTGGFMIVWAKNWGGMYALEQSVDNDGDGSTDCGGDCDDTNPLVWSRPVEISNLRISAAGPTSLSWDSQGSLAGSGTQYDLASGALLNSGQPDLASGTCLWSGTSATCTDARPDPETGIGFWYLVRGRNSCGVGTFGSSPIDASVTPCP